MSLQGHEKAARIIGDAFAEVGARDKAEGRIECALLALTMAEGFLVAAKRMDEMIRAEASGGKPDGQ